MNQQVTKLCLPVAAQGVRNKGEQICNLREKELSLQSNINVQVEVKLRLLKDESKIK